MTQELPAVQVLFIDLVLCEEGTNLLVRQHVLAETELQAKYFEKLALRDSPLILQIESLELLAQQLIVSFQDRLQLACKSKPK